MNRARRCASACLWAPALVLGLVLSAWANGIWWKNHDGTAGTTTNTWDALQAAIVAAQGGTGGQPGWVKICSDITRTNTAQGGHLAVTNTGNVTISGGWVWNAGAEPAAQSGRSKLDVNARGALNDQQRVVYVSTSNVTLEHLILTRGALTAGSGDNRYWGGGLYVSGASHFLTISNVVIWNNEARGAGGGGVMVDGNGADYLKGLRVTRCVVTNNAVWAWGCGGGLYVKNAGQSAYPTVIEFSDISFNSAYPNYEWSGGKGGGLFLGPVGKTLVANSTVVSNLARWGSGIHVESAGSARPRVTAFGCLVLGNRGTSPTVSSVYAYGDVDADALLLANTTIADNHEVGQTLLVCNRYASAGNNYQLRTCNTIFSDSDANVYLTQNRGDTRAYAALQHSTFNMATGFVAECTSGGTTNWTTVTDAVTSQDWDGFYRFHSLSANNVKTQNPEGNLQGDPGFLGTAPYPYQPDVKNTNALARAIDQGLQFTSGGGYIYLDVNVNGSYDALTDIIVDLNRQPHPGPGHFVYTTDLAGNRRVRNLKIDRGPYEYQPPLGTIVYLR